MYVPFPLGHHIQCSWHVIWMEPRVQNSCGKLFQDTLCCLYYVPKPWNANQALCGPLRSSNYTIDHSWAISKRLLKCSTPVYVKTLGVILGWRTVEAVGRRATTYSQGTVAYASWKVYLEGCPCPSCRNVGLQCPCGRFLPPLKIYSTLMVAVGE